MSSINDDDWRHDDDAWRAKVDEELRLAPWKPAFMDISLAKNPRAAQEALRELVKLYRHGGQLPPFVQELLIDLIDPQKKILNLKLELKWTGALERRVNKSDERHKLAKAIEAEQKRAGSTQKDAIENIARSSPRTAERDLRDARRDRKMIVEALGPFACSGEPKGTAKN
jgi:hypothetical protein